MCNITERKKQMDKKLWVQYADWKQNYKFVDLTHELSPQTPHWHGFPEMEISRLFDYPVGFRTHQFQLVSQYGTHVDAPVHFIPDGRELQDLRVEEMILPLCVIDVSKQVAADADYTISLADIQAWEKEYGEIPEGCFFAARSDWSNREDINNYDAEGDRHYPGWSMEALQYIIETRKVAAIGHETSDTDSARNAKEKGFLCETYVLEKDIYQIELMNNLSEVPAVGSLIFCGFPKAKNASGFTARCIAICPKN